MICFCCPGLTRCFGRRLVRWCLARIKISNQCYASHQLEPISSLSQHSLELQYRKRTSCFIIMYHNNSHQSCHMLGEIVNSHSSFCFIFIFHEFPFFVYTLSAILKRDKTCVSFYVNVTCMQFKVISIKWILCTGQFLYRSMFMANLFLFSLKCQSSSWKLGIFDFPTSFCLKFENKNVNPKK